MRITGPAMKIPFVDLYPQYLEIQPQLDQAIRSVITDSSFIGGTPLREFERDLARSFSLSHACGVSSCTAAITATLRSLQLGPEDEVITTAHSAVPTAEAIRTAGARVIFGDIEEGTYNLDPRAVEAVISPRTRVLLPVHLYGMPAYMEALNRIAVKHSLALIEDCAQAQGASYDGRPVGTFGRAACLSFFPSKNLGAWGDGGAVVTNDASVDRFVRAYSNHGRLDKYEHTMLGANERLDTLQAVILTEKLKKLEEWNARRRAVAGWYEQALRGVQGLVLPKTISRGIPIWHVYVVLVENRKPFIDFLSERGVATGLHYPIPLHLQPVFSDLGHKAGAFPVAEQVTSRCVSLPMYPHMSESQVDYVTGQIRAYFGS